MTLHIINRILFYAFATLADHSALVPDFKPTEVPGFMITETNYQEIATRGIFLPYFDGLLLPDPASIITFIQLFSPLLGGGPATIAENVETVMSGWSSAASTTAGRAISHALYCINCAVTSGFSIRPVFIRGEYSGCVAFGRTTAFVVGSKTITSSPSDLLIEEIGGLLSHEMALEKICEIINDHRGGVKVTPNSFQTPRAIHIILITLSLSPAESVSLRQQIKRLKFRQTFWSVSDHNKVVSVVRAIIGKIPLPADAPILYPSDAMFTSEPILSALSAFGVIAPSLLGKETVISRTIHKDMYTGIIKPGNLSGIPIFAKPLQEAYEDWSRLTKDGVVHFSHAGKDKMGRLRVKGMDGTIPFDTNQERDIMGELLKLMAKGKKREREEDVPEGGPSSGGSVEDEERRKRRRLKGLGMLFSGATLPEGLPEGDGDRMDDDSFFT
jgi:hypothetical protein